MFTSRFPVPLCALSVMLMMLSGCQDSLTTTESADNGSAPAETAVQPAPVETVAAQSTAADASEVTQPTTEEPAHHATSQEPTPEEPTELAKVTPVEPEPATVPATPEPEPPAEPELLGIGDAAPPLAVAEWVTGEPIDQLAAGQVYVVEFWATWCGPCKVSMPHLSELQEHYRDDVQFVGVTREDVATVQSFLGQEQSAGKNWKEVVTYRLATDLDDTMSQTYMRAAGQNGIPTAFIVGTDGVIEWIGHPMSMEDALASVVAGDWNRAAAIAEADLKSGLNERVRGREFEDALTLIEQFETEFGPTTTVTGYKLAILQMAGRTEDANALQAEVVEQNWDHSAKLNQIASTIAVGRAPGGLELAQRAAERASELANHEDAAMLATVARVYHASGETGKAVEWQTKAVEQAWDDSQMLNQVAMSIATGRAPGGLELAQRAAERAAELTSQENASILYTLAQVYQRMGETAKAAEWQGKTVEQAWDDPRMLNQVAWNIATSPAEGDLELAQRAAERASELTAQSDASILDTVARVHYEMGNLDKAVEWQTKAADRSRGNRQMTATLQRYEAELADKSAASEPTEDAAAPEEGESAPQDPASATGESAPDDGGE